MALTCLLPSVWLTLKAAPQAMSSGLVYWEVGGTVHTTLMLDSSFGGPTSTLFGGTQGPGFGRSEAGTSGRY